MESGDDDNTAETFDALTSLGFQAFDLKSTYSLDQYLSGETERPIPITKVPDTFTDCLFRRQ